MKPILLTLGILALAGTVYGDLIVDQNNTANEGNTSLNDGLEWQQQVTDEVSGALAGIELYTVSGSDSVVVSIGIGSAYDPGPFAFTTTVEVGSGGTFIDTSAADIMLTAGEEFVIDVSDGPGCCNLAAVTSLYSGGDLYLNNHGTIIDINDTGVTGAYSLAFQTFIQTTPAAIAPEPGTAVLFGLGVAGLIQARKRRTFLQPTDNNTCALKPVHPYGSDSLERMRAPTSRQTAGSHSISM
jgi:hypothetical protein